MIIFSSREKSGAGSVTTTIPIGGHVSSAKSRSRNGRNRERVPTSAREVFGRSQRPDDWAEEERVPTNARQVDEQSKHGGARPGSGRPKVDPAAKAKAVGFSLPPHLIAWIEMAAAESGMSKSAFVAHVLERSRRAAQRRKRS